MNIEVPISMDASEVEKVDPLTLQSWFNSISEKQDAYISAPETAPELTPEECKFAILLTRILRRTNTGPAKAKRASTKGPTKKAATAAFLDDFLK